MVVPEAQEIQTTLETVMAIQMIPENLVPLVSLEVQAVIQEIITPAILEILITQAIQMIPVVQVILTAQAAQEIRIVPEIIQTKIFSPDMVPKEILAP